MPTYKTKIFARFARREGLTDASLIEAIERAARGLVDADLGGGLIKQRVARAGEGKRGGFRTLIAYRSGDVAVFLYGFAKSDRSNVADDEERDFRELGNAWLDSKQNIDRDLDRGVLIEVKT